MACRCYQKSTLVAIATREINVVEGDYITYDLNRIHTGVSISHSEGSNVIRLNKAGLYLVTFDGVFTIGTAGSVNVQLFNNGVEVAGAMDTVSGTTTVPRGLHFTTLIEVKPSCCAIDNEAILQVQINADGVVNNASITVVKEA